MSSWERTKMEWTHKWGHRTTRRAGVLGAACTKEGFCPAVEAVFLFTVHMVILVSAKFTWSCILNSCYEVELYWFFKSYLYLRCRFVLTLWYHKNYNSFIFVHLVNKKVLSAFFFFKGTLLPTEENSGEADYTGEQNPWCHQTWG